MRAGTAATSQRPQRVARSVVATTVSPTLTEERREIQELLARYRADDREAWASLAMTTFLWTSAVAALHVTGGHWAAVIFLAGTLARCFLVFHDAAHLAFFEGADSNRNLASVMQFFASYSYQRWEEVHNSHHAHFGDSTVQDNSLTIWFSEEELATKPWYFSLGHRVLRDPLLFYPLAGFFVFFVNKPVEQGLQRIVVPALVGLFLGPSTALCYVFSGWLAGMVGVAFFHLQHHCNSPYRLPDASKRTSLDAAMLGSTRMPLPFPASLFSFGIEYHHIHHLDVRVPGYRLQRCDAEGQARGLWHRANTIDGWRAFKSLFHSQFEGSKKFADEEGRSPRFTSFWPYSALGLQDV